MPHCFVIQPFDKGKFDKRFVDVFKPAIEAAGLEAYRVDLDPSVNIPIDSIEGQIRASAVCLADITTDNPNVWYELGYAFAKGKSVVMVCSNERTTKYPFDIQHRTVTSWKAESKQDFIALEQAITARINAILNSTEALESLSMGENVAPVAGLSQPELAVIVALAGQLFIPEARIDTWRVRQEVENAGFTEFGFTMGLRRLTAKNLIAVDSDEDGHWLSLTEVGWKWIEKNEDRFSIRKPPGKPKPKEYPSLDDVPF